MKYRGRISFGIGMLLTTVCWNIVLHTLGPYEMMLALIFSCIAWWGGQFDTALFALKELETMKIELEESGRHYRTLIENSPEPILVHSEGRIVFLNIHALELLGANSLEEVLGLSIFDFVLPEGHQAGS